MRNLRRAAVVLGFVLISLTHRGHVASAQELAVTIGVPAPITGSQATIGDSMVKGAQVAVDQAKGIKITLDVQDEACDPQAGVNAANKLIADKVATVVGYFCSGATLPSVTVFHRAHMPTVIAAAAHPAITQQGFPEIFRVVASNAMEAPSAAKYMQEAWKAKSFAIVHDNTAVQKSLADATANLLKNAGGNVLLETAITPNTTEFGVTVAQIKSLNPDAVFLPLYYAEAALLTKQLYATNYGGKILEGDGGVEPNFVKIAGEENAEKVVFVSQPVTSQLPGAKSFIAAYKAKYGDEPGPWTVYEYDAMNVAIAVLKQTNSTDPDKLIDALKNYHGEGTIGPIQFDATGQSIGTGFPTLVVRKGEFVLGP